MMADVVVFTGPGQKADLHIPAHACVVVLHEGERPEMGPPFRPGVYECSIDEFGRGRSLRWPVVFFICGPEAAEALLALPQDAVDRMVARLRATTPPASSSRH